MEYSIIGFLCSGVFIVILSHRSTADVIGVNNLFIVTVSKARPGCLTILVDLPRGDMAEIHEHVDTPLLIVQNHRQNSERGRQMEEIATQVKCSNNIHQWKTDKMDEDILAFEMERTLSFFLLDGKAEIRSTYYGRSRTFLQTSDVKKNEVILSTFCPSQNGQSLSTKLEVITGQPVTLQSLQPSCNTNSLSGKTFNVSFKSIAPFIYLDANQEIVGIEADFLKTIASKLGFHLHLVVEDHWVFFDQETLSWDGVYASVGHGKSDLGAGINGIVSFPGQDYHLDFSCPILDLSFALLARKPKPLPPYGNLTRPFSVEVWITVLLLLFALALTVFLIKVVYRKGNGKAYQILESAEDSFFLVLKSVCNQSFKNGSQTGSGFALSLCLATWIICCHLLVSFYECNLRAHIIKSDYSKPMENYHNLLLADRDLFIPIGAGILEQVQASGLPNEKQIAENAVKHGIIFEYTANGDFPYEVLEKIDGEDGATITSHDSASFDKKLVEIAYNASFMRMGKETLCMLHGAIVLTPRGKHNDQIKTAILKSCETGLMQKIKSDYEFKWNITEDKDTSELHPFTLEHLLSGFFIEACGLLLALFVFAYELKTFQGKA